MGHGVQPGPPAHVAVGPAEDLLGLVRGRWRLRGRWRERSRGRVRGRTRRRGRRGRRRGVALGRVARRADAHRRAPLVEAIQIPEDDAARGADIRGGVAGVVDAIEEADTGAGVYRERGAAVVRIAVGPVEVAKRREVRAVGVARLRNDNRCALAVGVLKQLHAREAGLRVAGAPRRRAPERRRDVDSQQRHDRHRQHRDASARTPEHLTSMRGRPGRLPGESMAEDRRQRWDIHPPDGGESREVPRECMYARGPQRPAGSGG